MKRLAILILALGTSISAFSQGANVQSAWNYRKSGELDKAKEMIDAASVHEKTKTWAKTWYYRGLIYQDMFDTVKLNFNNIQIAVESYKKALELEPKGDYVDDINAQMRVLSIILFNTGLKQFNSKKYDNAFKSFSTILYITPTDTGAVLNSAISADRAGNTAQAKEYYGKLINMKYKDPKIYTFLAGLYTTDKDTAKAMEVIGAGRKLFPDDNGLLILELNYYLLSGRTNEAVDRINIALKKNPKDAQVLYFDLGTIYDKASAEEYKAGKQAECDADLVKAEDAYKKAIEIKSDYFDAYYSIGAMYFNLAAEMNNKANEINPNDVKAYAAAKEKFDAKFKQAQPYLEKALELKPKDQNTLISLKQLYARLDMMDKSNEMKKRMDEK